MARWTLKEISKIEQEQGELLIAVRCEPALKSTLTSSMEMLLLMNHMLLLCFPVQVKLDLIFRFLKIKKDSFRSSITDLLLEGVLHCKQMKMLSQIVSRMKQRS
ncbi:hypothetical protein KXD40_007829 [Peronospora effusa]|uniref:Uncharacterized protein n=1 Tax=Peronospora effusa TaxID=542832 RepID=A0A425BVZ8_9STRA|nr:hypothetical protein DD237_006636 [Peronospora effusa]UIZ23468.1 hypothetical protein KXD40_007829 [Peronospora effusa]